MYEKLARGELPDEEDKEKYCVDFFQKSIVQDEHGPPAESQHARDAGENNLENDVENDDSSFLNSNPVGPGRTSITVDRDEHKQFVRYVHAMNFTKFRL